MKNSAAKQIPYGHQTIDNSDIKAVIKVLKSFWITQGPTVQEFEQKFAKKVGAKFAVAVSNGTAALFAACAVCGFKKDEEIIVPTLSFVASANCVLYVGAKPVLVDVYPDTLTIDVDAAHKKITKRTKAIIAVDFAGHPADWYKLKQLAKKYNLILIDDASHALGSKFRGKPLGSIANLTAFSFHPVKTITTGEGGMVTTNDEKLYKSLIAFRNHGILKNQKSQKMGPWYYEVAGLGHNLRMTDMQAALGISQLKKLDLFIKKRRSIWQKYQEALGNNALVDLPTEKPGYFCGWHIFPVRLNSKINRRKIFEELRNNGIGAQVHYIPIHLHPFYRKKLGYKSGDFPNAEAIYESEITLPLFPLMTRDDTKRVISVFKNAINKFRT